MSDKQIPFGNDKLRRLREGAPWMTNTVLCLLGLGLVLLTKEYVWEYGGSGHYVLGGSGCSGWSVWLYVAAVIVIMTQPVNRWTLGIVLGVAGAMQLMTLFADPFSSSDIYRYVWDGVVQHAGVNPYRYVPGNQALAWLRAPNQDTYDMINRRDYAVTIYPPVAQMIYWLVTWFSPTMQAMKAAMVGFECVTVWALLRLLQRLGRPAEQVLLFAWCPLLAWEIAGAGHVDAAVFAFIALAMLARLHDKPGWTGLLLGLAVMTKFYPLVLLPALWMRTPEAKGLRRLGEWRLPAALVSVVVVGYAMYSSVGMKVFGFLSGYAKEEGIDSGSRFFFLDFVHSWPRLAAVPEKAFYVFAMVVLGALSWWGWRWAAVECFASSAHNEKAVMMGTPGFMKVGMMLAMAMMLLFSPHYPWYIVWLIPFFALVPNVTLMMYLMMFFYMFTTALADGSGPKMFVLNKILYGAVAGAFLLEVTVLRRWPLRRLFGLRALTANTEDAEGAKGREGLPI
jgi:hypothetical protein